MLRLLYQVLSAFFWTRSINGAINGHPLGLAAKVGMPALRRRAYGKKKSTR
jgi:hypothetical protein